MHIYDQSAIHVNPYIVIQTGQIDFYAYNS